MTRTIRPRDQSPAWWLKKVVILPVAPSGGAPGTTPGAAEWTLAREGAQRLAGQLRGGWSPHVVQSHRTPADLWALAAGLVLHSRELRQGAADQGAALACPEARMVYLSLGAISSASQSLSWRGVSSPAGVAASERRLLGAVLPRHLRQDRPSSARGSESKPRLGLHLRRREWLLVSLIAAVLLAGSYGGPGGEDPTPSLVTPNPGVVLETWAEDDLLVVEVGALWDILTPTQQIRLAVESQLDAGALGLRPVELRDDDGRTLLLVDRLGRPLAPESRR